MKTTDFNKLVAKAIAKIIVQGKLSLNLSGFCAYRGKNNAVRCVVGHMIDNNFYNSHMEDRKINEVYRMFDINLELTDAQIIKLDVLQSLHDNNVRMGDDVTCLESFKNIVSDKYPNDYKRAMELIDSIPFTTMTELRESPLGKNIIKTFSENTANNVLWNLVDLYLDKIIVIKNLKNLVSINSAFVWDNTPQGVVYWGDIDGKLRNLS